ncbi:MAG: sodium:alanine symporter family protein [Clostridia bacterium]|nr:sodium:alanine symporter family protein [Clostridia bacterium]
MHNIADYLWRSVMPVLLCAAGLRLIPAVGASRLSPRGIISRTLSKKRSSNQSSPIKTLFTALGGTIGVGNTVGVAAAIKAGGAGAVFWMILSSFAAMSVKYAETFLSCRYKDPALGFGGPMHYMKKLRGFSPCAILFSAAAIPAALFVGNAAQSDLVCRSLESGFGFPRALGAGILAVSVGTVILGGARRITDCCSAVVPVMSLAYCAACLALIASKADCIPDALGAIVTGAASPVSAAGGIGGFALSKAVSAGFSKGMFSNEAGMGSSPMAHTRSDENDPEALGSWGVLEVFIDTTLICTLSALVILTSGAGGVGEAFAVAFGKTGEVFFAVSMCCFAFASMCAWSMYALSALKFLTRSRTAELIFKLVFTSAVFTGAVMTTDRIILFADVFNALMATPNLAALFFLAPELSKTKPKKPNRRRNATICVSPPETV